MKFMIEVEIDEEECEDLEFAKEEIEKFLVQCIENGCDQVSLYDNGYNGYKMIQTWGLSPVS